MIKLQNKLPLYQSDLARKLGVTRGAIADRIRRGTLPPFDGKNDRGRGYWWPKTVEHIVTAEKPSE